MAMSLTERQVIAAREPVVVADDPVRQVAAVRAAGHAEPGRVGEAVRDEGIDPGEDVAHRARAPVAMFASLNAPP